MTINANQRIENAVLVAASDKGDAHAAVTKIRFFNEDGSPVDFPALAARVAALEEAANARVEVTPSNDKKSEES